MAVAGGRGRGRGVGGERCSTAGCTNKAQASGRCRTHTGALGQCNQSGCEKQAQYKGLCVAHGGRRVCTVQGCSKTVTSKGLCGDHGGGRRKHSGGRRPSVKQETSGTFGSTITESGRSMMSLLLNEWPQDVGATDSGQAPSTWTGQAIAPMTSASEPMSYSGVSAWTVGDTKFSTAVGQANTVADPASTASPQEIRCSGPMSQALPVWTEGQQNIKLAPLIPSAAVMPATSNRSGGSMMSLLLGGWSEETTDRAKSEERSAEREPVGSPDSDKSTGKASKVRKRALCTFEGCTKIAQSQGRCVTHGGKRCIQEGCIKSAQYQGLCTTHGGARMCTYPGCSKTIRSAGRCFEHGGGKQCSHAGCTKQAQSNGLCCLHRRNDVILDVLI
ncbi:hypothetical protein V7S43_009892 [Phytophthora oleae]|uniref:WRKY19-like zinc finger domain-containing protein n=1 Tax=Phytophthora oleae TaxID=2107226 RepID=A0ABD3FG33_9STRA